MDLQRHKSKYIFKYVLFIMNIQYIYIYIYIYVYIYIRIPRSFGIHIHIISNHYYEVTTFLVCEYFCHLNQKLE